MYKIIAFILILQLLSCSEDKKVNKQERIEKVTFYEYEGVLNYITQTISKDTSEISISKISDSIYVYKMNRKVGTKWLRKYSIDFGNELISTTDYDTCNEPSKSYILDKRIVTLSESQSIHYPIYKVLTTQENSFSGSLDFWTPEFGILITRFVDFRGYCNLPNRMLFRTEFISDTKKNKEMRELSFCIFSNIYCSYDFYSLTKQEFIKIVSKKD